MAYQITYDSNINCIVARVTGKINLNVVKQFVCELVRISEEHGCTRILNDARGVSLNLSTIDILGIPKFVSEAGLKSYCRRAIIVSGYLKDASLFETVSRNYDQDVMVFQDVEQAKQWLLTRENDPLKKRLDSNAVTDDDEPLSHLSITDH